MIFLLAGVLSFLPALAPIRSQEEELGERYNHWPFTDEERKEQEERKRNAEYRRELEHQVLSFLVLCVPRCCYVLAFFVAAPRRLRRSSTLRPSP